MSDEEWLCSEILRCFREQGFEGDRLPPDSQHQIPDLQLSQGTARYLVEVKQKWDDPEVTREREAELAGSKVADFTEEAHRTSLGKIFNTAVKQLRTRAANDKGVFRIIWFECEGGNSLGQAEQVYNAAFGSCRVLERDGPSREGFYLHESAFFKHREDLDAIICNDVDGGRLLLNNRSPRAEQIRDSGIVRCFRSGGVDAVVDPMDREARGQAFVADCDLPRRDKPGVLRYLKQKYGVNDLDTMDLAAMAGVVRVPFASVSASPAVPGEPVATDRWHFYADLDEIIEAVTHKLPDGWECLSLSMRSGPHEATVKVRRRGDGALGSVRVDLLAKSVVAQDIRRLP